MTGDGNDVELHPDGQVPVIVHCGVTNGGKNRFGEMGVMMGEIDEMGIHLSAERDGNNLRYFLLNFVIDSGTRR